jgi:rhodanese-related sulfurtransferase
MLVRVGDNRPVARRTIDDLLSEARTRLRRVTPAEALEAQGAGALLIDTRSLDERERHGVIPGAVHVPLSVLPWRLDPDFEYRTPELTDLSRQVILVCADGYSSSLAAVLLQEIGFTQATDLDGGFNGWKAAGFPVDPAEARTRDT